MDDFTDWAPPPTIDAGLAEAVREVAVRQRGVARRSQLQQLGVTNAQMDRSVDAGRWQAIRDTILVLHNGPLTTAQREGVATLAVTSPCALTARTAAASAGLRGWSAPALEVVVVRGTEYPELPFHVRVHESRRFGEGDVLTTWPPRVRIERALVDAAAWANRPRTACGLVAAGVQQRLTSAERLSEVLEAAGQIRFKRLLRSAIRDIGGGAQAVSEMDLLRWCRRHGFPMPVMQQVRTDARGRRRYIDATFVLADGSVLRVEIDGALHLLVKTYWDDMSRGNELTIGKERQLRFPSYVIYSDDPEAVDQMRRALNLSGPPAQTAA